MSPSDQTDSDNDNPRLSQPLEDDALELASGPVAIQLTTIGSRGFLHVEPAVLAPGGLQLVFDWAGGNKLIVSLTDDQANKLMTLLNAELGA